MKRVKGILASLRLVESFLLTRTVPARSLHFQVTQYSHLSPLLSSSLSKKNHSNNDFLNTHQKFYFSSKPDSIVELVTTNDWSEDLEKELEKSHLTTPTHGTVLYVLKNLEKTPKKAFHFFNWVSHKHGFKPSSIVYGLMLRILGNKETINQFWVLTKKMSDDGCNVDAKSYRPILGNFKTSKMKNEATAWTEYFNKMAKESATDAIVKVVVDFVLGPDWNNDLKKKLEELKVTLSENTMLSILAALREWPLKALEFFHRVSTEIGCEHNAVTYNGILKVLGQKESIKEFWSMVKEMKTAGHELDIDTYVKVSRHFHRSRMVNDSVELYELMMDGPYKPPDQDCRLLLRDISMSPTPDLDLVSRVINKYESTGHTLDKAVYVGYHRSFTSAAKFEEAEKVLDKMRNVGLEPDILIYRHLVFGLCKAGKLEEAIKVLDEMEAKGCVPDMKTWRFLIEGHYKAAEIELVDKANLKPLEDLIMKLLGKGKLEEAKNLVLLMKKYNFPPFEKPFVDDILKLGTVDDESEILKAMKGI